jgi:hypothetical protein
MSKRIDVAKKIARMDTEGRKTDARMIASRQQARKTKTTILVQIVPHPFIIPPDAISTTATFKASQ